MTLSFFLSIEKTSQVSKTCEVSYFDIPRRNVQFG